MWRDLKSVLRALIRQPLVATVVVGTVALGIGGSVAVFWTSAWVMLWARR